MTRSLMLSWLASCCLPLALGTAQELPSGDSPTGRTHAKELQSESLLRRSFEMLDLKAKEIARKYRQIVTQEGSDSAQVTKLRQQLHQVVREAFEARQKLQQLQVDRMTRQLEQVRKKLEAREASKDAIIRRRVEELLHPEVKWPESGSASLLGDVSKAKSQPAPISPPRSLIEALRQRAKAVEREYREGRARAIDVFYAMAQYHKAKVAIADSMEKKRAAQRDYVALLKDLKRLVEAQFRSGKARGSDVLEAEAWLIEAQEWLIEADAERKQMKENRADENGRPTKAAPSKGPGGITSSKSRRL